MKDILNLNAEQALRAYLVLRLNHQDKPLD
jgi:hypothetical protein